MNEFQSYEYTIKQRCEGIVLAKRICLIAIYMLCVLILLGLGFITRIFVPFLALVPLCMWILIYFTWRYVDVEFELSLVSGTLTLSKIFGGKSRKRIFETCIKDMVAILPHTEENYEKVLRFSPTVEYRALSSDSSENAYFALFLSEKEEKAVLFFEPDGENGKILKIMKFYNASAMTA